MQRVITLDLEGVILPEMWKRVAAQTGVEELGLTTRDIEDYNVLMEKRIAALKEHAITIDAILPIVSKAEPLEGAIDFFLALREQREVIIVSDTFVEFFDPFRIKLQYPVIFCNSLEIDANGIIQKHVLRQRDGKFHVVKRLQSLNFFVIAAGDSYNDLSMIQAADYGALFNPPQSIFNEYPQIPKFNTYTELQEALLSQ